jgi:hypothetical protein
LLAPLATTAWEELHQRVLQILQLKMEQSVRQVITALSTQMIPGQLSLFKLIMMLQLLQLVVPKLLFHVVEEPTIQTPDLSCPMLVLYAQKNISVKVTEAVLQLHVQMDGIAWKVKRSQSQQARSVPSVSTALAVMLSLVLMALTMT